MFFSLLFPPVLQLSLSGLEPSQNPWCLASGPNEAQAVMSHCKNSVRDTAIGKRWICSDIEKHTLQDVGHCKGQVPGP